MPAGAARTIRRSLSPRWATAGVFLVNGAAIGTWVAHIPWVQQRFGLSKSELGLVIAGMSVAVVLTLPLAGQAVVRYGSRRVTLAGGVACALAVNLTVLAPRAWLVAMALFVLGASSATMDVGMNTHGVGLERGLGRPIMSSLHAGWSFGGVIGAALAAALVALGLDSRIAVAVASLLLLVALASFGRRMEHGSAAVGADAPRFALPSRGLLLLAILCLLAMLTEGAMADWGGLYLRQSLRTSAAVAALAFAFFTAGMTVGRVIGDRINRHVGPLALLRGGAVLTGVPLAVMLLAGAPAAAPLGLFAIGLGVANGVPLMFSAAGRRPDMPPAPGIAAVSSMGSLGFLAGPPVIGVLAGAVSLPWALATLILGSIAVFGFAGRAVGITMPPPRGSRPAPGSPAPGRSATTRR